MWISSCLEIPSLVPSLSPWPYHTPLYTSLHGPTTATSIPGPTTVIHPSLALPLPHPWSYHCPLSPPSLPGPSTLPWPYHCPSIPSWPYHCPSIPPWPYHCPFIPPCMALPLSFRAYHCPPHPRTAWCFNYSQHMTFTYHR
jgi:hypothetical protein